jgi:hypothetical protein
MIWKYKVRKLHNTFSRRKYYVALVNIQQSCAQLYEDTDT